MVSIGLVVSPVISFFAVIGCNTNKARISNRSVNPVMATLELKELVLWRGKIEADQTVEPLYRTACKGQIRLTVEFSGKKFEALGGVIYGGLLMGTTANLDVFVIESDRIVDATTRLSSWADSEGLSWFGACVVQAVRDLTGTPDPHRPSLAKDKQ